MALTKYKHELYGIFGNLWEDDSYISKQKSPWQCEWYFLITFNHKPPPRWNIRKRESSPNQLAWLFSEFNYYAQNPIKIGKLKN